MVVYPLCSYCDMDYLETAFQEEALRARFLEAVGDLAEELEEVLPYPELPVCEIAAEAGSHRPRKKRSKLNKTFEIISGIKNIHKEPPSGAA